MFDFGILDMNWIDTAALIRMASLSEVRDVLEYELT